MGFSKEEKSRRILRGFKTVFFLVTMVISFLVFSAPVFLVIADTILPSALLSASLFCDGPKLSRGPYLGTTMICCVSSLVFVSIKASYALGWISGREGSAMETALFICSLALAIAHIIVAYRTSCRERRKLLVYKIDIEAISACKNGFPRYPKIVKFL
ncbi:hypothetical protein CXB51_003543 [Gossypium anomalum]|uniref:MENTAL domain-containing protein n=1 Tax=Gossypium anomalum TaxID=47600 RepID=A0A8J5ZH77_9ROSI|nr:hypothetical protein CXB51_003543 [Gossypium anomalum]